MKLNNTILHVFIAIIILISISCEASREVIELQKNQGKTFYTSVNIWYENWDRIYSTNYHKGSIIPAGTEVHIEKISSNSIVFKRGNLPYKILYVKKHSGRDINAYFNQIFAPEFPPGSFANFNDAEKQAIKEGKIIKGMSKEAVIMSWGIPPRNLTYTTEDDRWNYMVHRFRKRTVEFSSNRVMNIK